MGRIAPGTGTEAHAQPQSAPDGSAQLLLLVPLQPAASSEQSGMGSSPPTAAATQAAGWVQRTGHPAACHGLIECLVAGTGTQLLAAQAAQSARHAASCVHPQAGQRQVHWRLNLCTLAAITCCASLVLPAVCCAPAAMLCKFSP